MFSHAFSNLDNRKWIDRMQPQTIAIATWLLYSDGVFALVGFIDKGDEYGLLRTIGGPQALFAVAAILAFPLGGFLMANGKLLGWYVAIAASFTPLVSRLFIALEYDASLRFILTGGRTLSFLFEVALIALLLHKMSRSYAHTWLR
jgi:hypothetical protein